jgi:hypothetical protein
MNDFTAIGLLMILGTICAIVYTAFWFGVRAAAQQNTLTHMARLQGAQVPQEQK